MPTAKLQPRGQRDGQRDGQPPADMPRVSMARAGAPRPRTATTDLGSTETRSPCDPEEEAQIGPAAGAAVRDRDAGHVPAGDLLVSHPAGNGAAAGANGQASSARASSVLADLSLDGTAQARILRRGAATGRLTHIQRIPARRGRRADWPDWVPAELREALAAIGAARPWTHQARAARLGRSGRNVIISTGTASGKSLGYLVPALTAVLEGGTALYVAPTRALAADQLRLVTSLGLRGVRAVVVDGDTPIAERTWARSHANYLLTTPDMLHYNLLPRHAYWDGFFRRLGHVVVDECHTYRGVFGSHIAHVLRRLRRVIAARAGREAVFMLASATISEPTDCARLLTGLPATAVTSDGAP